MMKLEDIKLELIMTNPAQPRKSFEQEGIEELAQSIKESGLIQPIIVRPSGKGYMVVAGERRLRAIELLGMASITCIIIEASSSESANLSLIENIQRSDLSPLEEALAYQALLQTQNITQEELAKRIGKSQSSIANKLRLLQLAPEVKEAIINKAITERHGRCLLGLEQEKQEVLLRKIIVENLTVAQTERLIKKGENQRIIIRKDFVSRTSAVQLGVNTINEAITTVKSAGIPIKSTESETAKYYQIVIRIKK